MKHRVRVQFVALLLLTFPLTGCLFRSRTVQPRATAGPVQTATQQELLERINTAAQKVSTLNMTVDIATSVGGARRGKVTDYKEIRGYVLVRKPADLRLIGLMPIVRNTAFDMVSDGEQFMLWIPPTNKFYMGSNSAPSQSKNALENLRPQIFYDALMLRAVDPQDEIAVVENRTEVLVDPKTKKEFEQPDYSVVVIRKGRNGWFLSRKVVISRTDLQAREQLIYDEQGNLITQARYDDYKQFDGLMLPTVIQIWRPLEEYQITLKALKVRLNEPMKDTQFALQRPSGAQVVRLDQPRNGTGQQRAGNGRGGQ